MKLLIVSKKSDRSEASLFCWLSTRGHQVTIVCHPGDRHQETYRRAGIPVYERAIRNRLDLPEIFFLRKLLQKEQFDLAYSSFNAGLSCANLAAIGGLCHSAAYRGTLGNVSRWDPSGYLTYLHPNVKAIACNCEAVQTFLAAQGLDSSLLRTVYKGHDSEWYRGETALRREELGLPEDVPLIGCTANFRPLKGLEVLIEAFGELSEETGAHLVLVGEERTGAERQLVERLGLSERVHLLGYHPHASRISPLFQIAVMPSTRREGVPRAIIEAMSQGVCCVVSDVGGLPELIEDNVSGRVVRAGDISGLRDALRRLLSCEETRASFGRAARKRVDQRFNLQLYFERMEELFLAAAESRRKRVSPPPHSQADGSASHIE